MRLTGSDRFGYAALGLKDTEDQSLLIYISNFNCKDFTWNVYAECEPEWKVKEEKACYYDVRDEYNDGVEQVEYDSYELVVNNLPWGPDTPFKFERYVIDDTHNLEKVEEADMPAANSFTISRPNPSYEVQIIRLYVPSRVYLPAVVKTSNVGPRLRGQRLLGLASGSERGSDAPLRPGRGDD